MIFCSHIYLCNNHSGQDIEPFLHPEACCVPLACQYFPPKATTILTLVLSVLQLHINGIIQRIYLCLVSNAFLSSSLIPEGHQTIVAELSTKQLHV